MLDDDETVVHVVRCSIGLRAVDVEGSEAQHGVRAMTGRGDPLSPPRRQRCRAFGSPKGPWRLGLPASWRPNHALHSARDEGPAFLQYRIAIASRHLRSPSWRRRYEQPLVEPQFGHLWQAPVRTTSGPPPGHGGASLSPIPAPAFAFPPGRTRR